MVTNELRNHGHGHVHPRPDGVKARCGGPGICGVCSREMALERLAGAESEAELGREAHEELESLRAKVARVETVADEWEGLAGYLRTHHADNPAIMREAYGHAIAAEKVRAALEGAE